MGVSTQSKRYSFIRETFSVSTFKTVIFELLTFWKVAFKVDTFISETFAVDAFNNRVFDVDMLETLVFSKETFNTETFDTATFITETFNTETFDKRELDIYIPSKKLAIEYNGVYYHSEYSGLKDMTYHLSKTLFYVIVYANVNNF